MEAIKRYSFILLLLWGCLLSATARSWNADNTPMVHLEDAQRYLCDPEQLISPQYRDSIDYYLQKLDKDCGIESVFVIINHVDNGDTFRYATEIGKKYGVGNKRTHRGLVVVVAVEDHRYFIATGKGLESDLTDAETDIVAQRCIVPNMRKNVPDEAMLLTAKTLYKKFKTGKLDTDQRSKQGSEDGVGGFIGIILIAVVIIFWWYWINFRNDDDQNNNRNGNHRGPNNRDSDLPFILWGLGMMSRGRHSRGGFGGNSGGSFGGGSFGGGGSGGSW